MALLTKPFNGAPLRDVKLDAVKGFLILCIILEHNSLLTLEYSWIRPFSDAFAAGAFLILSFLRPIKVTSFMAYLDKYLSHWVPFTLFTLLLAILHFIFFGSEGFFLNLFKAIFFASPQGIKESTGFMYIWFLPCLVVLYLLRFLQQKMGNIILILAFFSFFLIGEVEVNILVTTPYSLHVIAFIYILGVIYHHIHRPLTESSKYIRLASVVLFSVLCLGTVKVGWHLFLAGGIIPSWREPFLLLYYGVMLTIAIPCIYNVFSFLPDFIVNFFAGLGEKSLLLYLLHPIVFFVFFRFLNVDINPWVSFVVTIVISVLLAVFMKKIPMLHNLVFPSYISNLIRGKKV
jgi:fucose 4-O-acetylase-like acetyltransferase